MIRSPERRVVAAGHVVYREGDDAACAYLVLRGSVEVKGAASAQRQAATLLRPGELFGDLALVARSPHRATATALEETELLAITSAQVFDRLEGIDPLLRLCLSAIVARYGEASAPSGSPPRPNEASTLLPAWTAHAQAAQDVLFFEHQLRAGIERDELDLHFQPIVELSTGMIAGFEGLIRWHHPDRGLLMPRSFIPLAETSGVICDLTDLCLRKVGQHFPAIRAATAGNSAVAARPFVSVNVSGLDLMQSAFAARTVSTLCDAGIDPEDVRLEVTESILMKDAERCALTLQNCRDQGIAIAIDDFGTGYSSLHYLNALPISVLKMDQTFCRSLLSDEAGRKIIMAILLLGRDLGLSVIAEGIETAAQRDLLAAMGCGFGQGFLFGAALDPGGTLESIRTWRAVPAGEPRLSISPAA